MLLLRAGRIRLRRPSLWEVCLTVAVSYLALSAVRHAALFVAAETPLLIWSFSAGWERMAPAARVRAWIAPRARDMLAGAAAILVIAVLGTGYFVHSTLSNQARATAANFPVGAVRLAGGASDGGDPHVRSVRLGRISHLPLLSRPQPPRLLVRRGDAARHQGHAAGERRRNRQPGLAADLRGVGHRLRHRRPGRSGGAGARGRPAVDEGLRRRTCRDHGQELSAGPAGSGSRPVGTWARWCSGKMPSRDRRAAPPCSSRRRAGRVLARRPAGAARRQPRLEGHIECDLADRRWRLHRPVVARCSPSSATRRSRSSSSKQRRVAAAASGRNGGFCDASLTHGFANGLSRFPAELDTLERLGVENLDAIESTVREHVASTATSSEPA